MRDKNDAAFILRVLDVIGRASLHFELWWRTDGEYAPVTFLANCNDVFWWATSDCEEITPENIDVLERAIRDLEALPDGHEGRIARGCAMVLFVARVRGMRPQRPFLRTLEPYMLPLFEACGPERNPKEEG